MNFANHVDIIARDAPDRLAVTDPQREMSYGELAAETDAVADGLADLGVEPGDRVALFLPNSVTFLTAYFGTMKRGAIPVPVNLRFGPEEIGHVFQDAVPVALFTVAQLADAVPAEEFGVEHTVVAGGDDGIDYGALVADAEKAYDPEPRKDTELAELLYTSGTTGRPKGVKHTHGNLSANARASIRAMPYTRDSVALTVCPCFHVSGLNVTTTPFVALGAENHFLPEWDAGMALETMAARGVTDTMLIPTMLLDLLEHGTEGYDLSALERVVVGGSPMPKERIEAAESALGVTLLEGYGMTETTPTAVVNRPDQPVRKAGSIGPPIEDVVDVRIEDPETGEPVGTDEKGELLLHGDTVTPGYYQLPETNAEAFVERPAPEVRADGGDTAADRGGKTWLRTGDIVRMDADGHLFVEDRIDDMIITGGENVYPREIEDVIYELDGVQEAAVIGTPHDRLGEQVTAVVRGEVTADEVQRVCRDSLADYKIPRQVELADDLPKTSTRKIDKVALRDRFG